MQRQLGMTGFGRVESLNGSATFIQAMADVVKEHLNSVGLRNIYVFCINAVKAQ